MQYHRVQLNIGADLGIAHLSATQMGRADEGIPKAYRDACPNLEGGIRGPSKYNLGEDARIRRIARSMLVLRSKSQLGHMLEAVMGSDHRE